MSKQNHQFTPYWVVQFSGSTSNRDQMDKLIAEETGLPVVVADEPLTCVARGGGVALDMISKHSMGFLAAE